tara:strand:+ start:393 stop:599 length:207 start_codon:yes stop_codon:yes gene_type:complete
MYTREGQVSEEIAFRDIKAIIMPKSDQEHVLQEVCSKKFRWPFFLKVERNGSFANNTMTLFACSYDER